MSDNVSIAAVRHRYATDADKWHAVQTRDPAADGLFIYGVKTTRIYCRPNCKARLARRANVAFFPGAAAAEGAGFRACKRCKPKTVGVMPEDEAITRIRALLEKDGDVSSTAAANVDGSSQSSGSSLSLSPLLSDCSPTELASQAKVSRWHFHRKFKQVTGLTPLEYLQRRQAAAMKRAAASTTEQTVPPVPRTRQSKSATKTASNSQPDATSDETTDANPELFDFGFDSVPFLTPTSTASPDLDLYEQQQTFEDIPDFDAYMADMNNMDLASLDPTLWDMGIENCGPDFFLDANLFLADGGGSEVFSDSSLFLAT